MIYIDHFSERFFRDASRRSKRFDEKYKKLTTAEEVIMPYDVTTALGKGELVRGSVFADEGGTVRFTPYDIGHSAKQNPRKTTLPPSIRLDITLRVILERGQVAGVSVVPNSTLEDNDVMRFLNQLYHYTEGGMAHGNGVC